MSTCTDLAVIPKGTQLEALDLPYEESTEELDERQKNLLESIASAEKERDELSERLSAFASKITSVMSVSQKRGYLENTQAYLGLISKTRDSRREDLKAIAEEVKALGKRLLGEDDDSDEDVAVDYDAEIPDPDDAVEEQSDPDAPKGSTRNMRRLCKSIFARIAARTHPDKTADKDLNELFLMARRAYGAFDLDTLEEIWLMLKGGDIKRTRLQAALAALKDKLDNLRAELRDMRGSDAANLLKLDEMRGFDVVVRTVLESMTFAARKMEESVFNIKENINFLDDSIESMTAERDRLLRDLAHKKAPRLELEKD